MLEQNNIDFEFVNVKKDPIPKEQLSEIGSGLGMRNVYNLRGTTYRKLKVDYESLDEKERLELLHREQSMITRPLLEKNGRYHVGWDESAILGFVNS